MLPEEGLHLPTLINDLEKEMVEEAISRTGGNQTRAASLLQISVHSYRHLLSKHEVQASEERKKFADSSGN